MAPPSNHTTPAGLALNWGSHQVAWKLGGDRVCATCGQAAYMTNSSGDPQHKICAERELVATHGPAGAIAVAAAGYPPRGRRGEDGGRPGAR